MTVKYSLVLKTRTVKALRVWCAMNDVGEAETISPCLTNFIREAALSQGKGFSERFHSALMDATLFEDTDGMFGTTGALPRPEPAVSSRSTRTTGYRLTSEAREALKIFAVMTDRTMSAVADEAIWSRLHRLASASGDDFWNAFTAAVVYASYPEDD